MTSENTPRTDKVDWSMGGFEQMRNLACQLERELNALKRGEFICRKCSLRKDSEHDTPTEF